MTRPSFYPYCDRRHVITVHDTGKPCAQCQSEDAAPAALASAQQTETLDLTALGGPRYLTKMVLGHEFLVVDPPSIGFPGHSTVCFDEHEPTLGLLAQFDPDVFIDIGAQFGSYALPALAMGAQVIAFEPTVYASETLAASVKANGWGDRCQVRREALYDGTEYPAELKVEVFVEHYPSVNHPETTLDAVLFDGQVPTTDGIRWCIKIDVEGAELGVLRGAQRTLKTYRPTLIIEDHDGIDPGRGCQVSDFPASIDSSKKIQKMLKALGYTIEVVPFDVSRRYLVATPPPAA